MHSQQSSSDSPLLPSSSRRISSGIFEASPAELRVAEQNNVTLRGLRRSGPQRDVAVRVSQPRDDGGGPVMVLGCCRGCIQ